MGDNLALQRRLNRRTSGHRHKVQRQWHDLPRLGARTASGPPDLVQRFKPAYSTAIPGLYRPTYLTIDAGCGIKEVAIICLTHPLRHGGIGSRFIILAKYFRGGTDNSGIVVMRRRVDNADRRLLNGQPIRQTPFLQAT